MKRTIEWHEECLKNWRSYLNAEEDRLLKGLEYVKKAREEMGFYAKQIEEAHQKDKDGFDAVRFLQNRRT